MKKARELRAEFLKTMVQLATAGFGLVAALAWNDAIQSLIKDLLPVGSGVLSKIIYALVVTIIAVAVTYFLGKAAQRAIVEDEEIKPEK